MGSIGDRLSNVPYNQASLWTTYEIQKGNLKGLGFGLGLFYMRERAADVPNTITTKDYLRTDAAIYYRQDAFNAAINIRNLFDLQYISYNYGGLIFQRGEPFTINRLHQLGVLTRSLYWSSAQQLALGQF
ncbi:TonB-dependent receptor domain-containing protein [Nostoc sp.]|uniref:TonB-dependent receptor domain-containing protein n=1 Tax=Nostoc sp. TaxID=1180 RepID=UPI002FF9857E